MGKVQMLPDALINKIAAGEVVDRPASAVKELVENAIDAGATRIDIDIERGGKKLIRVADNGAGMSREDAEMALQRHATSKLRTENDLFQIMTMGFRGEALPSIASVSKFRLLTRPSDADEGTEIQMDGGKDLNISAAGRAQGTTVEISDLFFNLPGRKKFLKADGTEFSHIAEAITRLSLANPEIRFRLTHNRRVQLQAPGTEDLKDRVGSVLGRQVGKHMHPVELSTGWLKLEGLFSEPTTTTQGTKGIYLFVNGRFIKDRGLAHACQEAYRGTIEKGRYPYIVLFIEVDPSEVDVNVHPQKIEVRFQRQHEVYSRLLTTLRSSVARTPWLTAPLGTEQSQNTTEVQASVSSSTSTHSPEPTSVPEALRPPPVQPVSNASTQSDSTSSTSSHPTQVVSPTSNEHVHPPEPSNTTSAPSTFNEFRSRFLKAAEAQELPVQTLHKKIDVLPPLPTAQTGLPFLPGWDPPTPSASTKQEQPKSYGSSSSTHVADEYEPEVIETHEEEQTQPEESVGFFSSLQYIGQFAQMYLIFEAPNYLVLIDQHAAHERISYQNLLAAYDKSSIPRQSFLIPPRIELSLTAAQQAEQHKEDLEQLGIEIEPFGGQSYIIKSLPTIIQKAEPHALLNDLLEELSAGKRTASLDEKINAVLMRMACHGSVRGTHRLSADEVRSLQKQLDSVDFRAHCPHGRPVYFEMPQKEIEKRFHRT